jgi:hypothetical protein
MRLVDDTLKNANLDGKDRLIAVHGNRFILHLVFRALDDYDTDSLEAFETLKTRIPKITHDSLAKVTAAKEKQAATSYPANFFKNITKCKQLELAIV